jgi:hypothetical protein
MATTAAVRSSFGSRDVRRRRDMGVDISSTTIEFHRFGDESSGFFGKGSTYIRTCGYARTADQVVVKIEAKDFRRCQNKLRYNADRTAESEQEAERALGAEAANFLPEAEIQPTDESALHQIDIVTHASELRAYPFEAIYANASERYLASPKSGVILTRRIRSEFSYSVPPWPEVPSILFVHAPVDNDLPQALIDRHRNALVKALAPWGGQDDLEKRNLLRVCMVDSAKALKDSRALGTFSYIHILAHGAKVAEPDLEEYESEWGLRLGTAGMDATAPGEIADALRPQNDQPLVVTLAACDSGTTDRPDLGNASLVETMHRNGIPVVVGSQFPLTTEGSVTLTGAFYVNLLCGSDVRMALHAARVALREEARRIDERRHDWLSIVGYVRLPAEGYSQYLRAFTLRVQLHMLEAARKDAEALLKNAPTPDQYAGVEERLRDRITQLEDHAAALVGLQDDALRAECTGLLASACKSLAELYFLRGRQLPQEKARFDDLTRTTLEKSLAAYAQVYGRDVSKHWHGIQKLALEAALTGRIAKSMELKFVQYVAQQACDNPAEYWACGTVAEAILLATLTPERVTLDDGKRALALLVERSAKDAKDGGFAAKSTRRQLRRYVTWWTKSEGYFPGCNGDLSAQAAVLADCLAA